jgi:hypothetical protein
MEVVCRQRWLKINGMAGRLAKPLRDSLLALVLGYIGFNILCVITFAYSKIPTEPVPSLIVGIPVGLVIAIVTFIFSAVLRSSS